MSFLVLQLSRLGRECWLLYFCVLNVMSLLSFSGSVVCDCDISWSYSLTIFEITKVQCVGKSIMFIKAKTSNG